MNESIMSVYFEQRDFSFAQKLKKAFQGSLRGAKWGAILTPGNLILALCGKKKAALIMTGIGAGIGAGIGFYYGWKGEKSIENYKEKLNNDPEFQKEKKKELEDYMKELLSTSPYPQEFSVRDQRDYKNSGIPYRPDFYKYLELYKKFCQKYYQEWIEAWGNLKTIQEIDCDFNIVFPVPYLDEPESSSWYIAANGLAPSDHYWIAWEEESGEYNNDLGSGRGSGKTLLEASQNFAAQWIVKEDKIEDPGIREVAKIHNRIINEFLKLR